MLLPSAHPVVVGENVTFTETLCPAERVSGKVGFDTLNSLPVVLLAVTVTLVVPVFVKTTICVSDCPMGTAPKRMGEGVQVNCRVAAPAYTGSMAARSVRVMSGITRIDKD